jgi:hypothetical protein
LTNPEPTSRAAAQAYIEADLKRTDARMSGVLASALMASEQEMCPQCISPVHPKAVVCATCRRDLPDPQERTTRHAASARQALVDWQAEVQRALIREEWVPPRLKALAGDLPATALSARETALGTSSPFGTESALRARHEAWVTQHAHALTTFLDLAAPESKSSPLRERLQTVAPFPFTAYAAEIHRERRTAWINSLREAMQRLAIPLPPKPPTPPIQGTHTLSANASLEWQTEALSYLGLLEADATFERPVEKALRGALAAYSGKTPPAAQAKAALTRLAPQMLLKHAAVRRIPRDVESQLDRVKAAIEVACSPTARTVYPMTAPTIHAMVLAGLTGVASVVCAAVVPDLGLIAILLLVGLTFGSLVAMLGMWGATNAAVDDRRERAAFRAVSEASGLLATRMLARDTEWRDALPAVLAGHPVDIVEPDAAEVPPEPSESQTEQLPPPVSPKMRFVVAAAAALAGVLVTLAAVTHRLTADSPPSDASPEADNTAEEDASTQAEDAARRDAEHRAIVEAAIQHVIDTGIQALQPSFDACRAARITAETPENPYLGGTWTLDLTLKPEGKLTDVTLTAVTAPDPTLESCALQALQAAKFNIVAEPTPGTRELSFAPPTEAELAAASAPTETPASEATVPISAPPPASPEQAPSEPVRADPSDAVRAVAATCGLSAPARSGSSWLVQIILNDTGKTAANVRVSTTSGPDKGMTSCLKSWLGSQTFNGDGGAVFNTELVGGK